MSRLAILKKYFPTGTAEGDAHLLDKVFVTPFQLSEVLSTPEGSPTILLGRKGVGKTALMEWLKNDFSKYGVPTILIRPDDIDTTDFKTASDIASLKGAIHKALVSCIASKIGSELSGFLTGPEELLYNEAIAKGSLEPSFARKTAEVIKLIARPTSKASVSELIASITGSTNSSKLAKAIGDHLEARGNSFYLFIDDSDQIATSDDPNHLNRIWALLLSIRKLSQDCHSLKCIVSLRTEVWLRLTRNDRGQRDQIDHIRPLLVTLRSTSHHITQIITSRLAAAATEINEDPTDPFLSFFSSSTVRLPTTEDNRRSWPAFIVKSGRDRPRDAIQLIGHLIKKAIGRGDIRISDEDAEASMREYSRECAESLNIEFGEICNNLTEIIKLFAGRDFEWDFEDLRIFLRDIPSRFNIRVYGVSLQPNSDDSALTLLSILHEADFINPRKKDPSKPRGFDHISFLDDPQLVQRDRWNELQALTWDIHPVFRSYLISFTRTLPHKRKPSK
ncbi:hypothetical protein [Verrucomicrobium sp. BvORR106]|uniref:P-loop ATPase, Sll1717 family n=1 Tax=Verrucomicrobium sp. BvORR106 TaxID=1403819 RepID=UPI000AD35F10|nr:hypothetical protein [Verrucomicrobium sp. BvORR106]